MDDNKKQHIVETALDVFFKYGYKRVSMNEIAEAAGISRAGLYLYFKNKEEMFNAAIVAHSDKLIGEIRRGLSPDRSPEHNVLHAFEIWSIRDFDDSLHSPEHKEITDSSYLFAQEALDTSYDKLDRLLADLLQDHPSIARHGMPPERLAHLLTGASRGFKIVAKSSDELRTLIRDFIRLALPTGNSSDEPG